MDTLAPIGVITYSRINHLKQTIEALQKNTLAKESELYIFSDAPQKGDEGIVAKVREYIHTIDGFKEVHIVERKTNGRVANGRGGIKQLLDEYGRTIFMEDDIVTAPGFLQFMNDGLEFYKDNKKILSIGGHTPNLDSLKGSHNNVYFVRRFHPWGMGIWKDKYCKIKKLPKFTEIIRDKRLIDRLNEFGTDLLPMIKAESKGKLNATDLRACYLMNKENFYTVSPTQTLVKNIGLDGSGVHCGTDNPYANDILSHMTSFTFTDKIELNENVIKEYKKFYDRPNLIRRNINRIKKIWM